MEELLLKRIESWKIQNHQKYEGIDYCYPVTVIINDLLIIDWSFTFDWTYFEIRIEHSHEL